LLGVALMLARFRVDVPMLSGGSTATWHGWVHGIAFLLIIATGSLISRRPIRRRSSALCRRRQPGR
jgi:hypothetical protein